MNLEMLKGLGVSGNRIKALELLSEGPRTKEEITKALGLHGHYMYHVLQELAESGWIERTGEGKIGSPYRYRMRPVKKIVQELVKNP
jgi:sugar-specific transcriptional regulator TrmB